MVPEFEKNLLVNKGISAVLPHFTIYFGMQIYLILPSFFPPKNCPKMISQILGMGSPYRQCSILMIKKGGTVVSFCVILNSNSPIVIIDLFSNAQFFGRAFARFGRIIQNVILSIRNNVSSLFLIFKSKSKEFSRNLNSFYHFFGYLRF